ncbi:MAG: hypothetical protein U0871_09540 [Gemmataceae bacterium]
MCTRQAVGEADLTARPHRFDVEHAEGTGLAHLRVQWGRAGAAEWLPVPPWALFHREQDASALAGRRDQVSQAWKAKLDPADLGPAEIYLPRFTETGEILVARGRNDPAHRLAVDRLDPATGRVVRSYPIALAERLPEAELSPDGALLAVRTTPRDAVRVFRTSDGVTVGSLPVPVDRATYASWAADRPVLTLRSSDGWREWWPGWQATLRSTHPLAASPGVFGLAAVPVAGGRVVWPAIPSDERVTGDGWAVVTGPDGSIRPVALGFTPDWWAVDRSGRRMVVAPMSRGSSRALGLGAAVLDLDTGGLVAWLRGADARECSGWLCPPTAPGP